MGKELMILGCASKPQCASTMLFLELRASAQLYGQQFGGVKDC